MSKSLQRHFSPKLGALKIAAFVLILGGGAALVVMRAPKALNLTRQSVLDSEVIVQTGSTQDYELVKIKNAKTQVEAELWYRKLIVRVGPVAAQEKLNSLNMGTLHLVAHTVGNYLYEKYGAGGLIYCKEYFSGACYHGVILNFLGSAQQDKEIATALNVCQKAGGDMLVQCSHAIGHGLLAGLGYKNLPQALNECTRIDNLVPSLSLIDCHDGVFMENIFGLHDGGPSPDRWVKADDLNYPCDNPGFANYLVACWRNQISRVSEVVGANYPAIQKYCDPLDGKVREVCFSGIYRMISGQTKNNLYLASKQCAKVTSNYGGEYCVMGVASYSFFQGDRTTMLGYCNRLKGTLTETCFKTLVATMKNRIASKEQPAYCDKILPANWREYCQGYAS